MPFLLSALTNRVSPLFKAAFAIPSRLSLLISIIASLMGTGISSSKFKRNLGKITLLFV